MRVLNGVMLYLDFDRKQFPLNMLGNLVGEVAPCMLYSYTLTYKYNTFLGNIETEINQLRSILVQLEFTHVVRQYDERGIPFRVHLHVPEIHPYIGNIFLEREDEGHVLKVTVHMKEVLISNIHILMLLVHITLSYSQPTEDCSVYP